MGTENKEGRQEPSCMCLSSYLTYVCEAPSLPPSLSYL